MSGTFRITNLRFTAGSRVGASPLSINPSGTTIVVGPNNAGKSRLLREIEWWCRGEGRDLKVLSSMSVDFPSDAMTLERYIRRFEVQPTSAEHVSPDHIVLQPLSFGEEFGRPQFYIQGLENFVVQMQSNPSQEEAIISVLRQQLLRYYVARLDGAARFALITPRATGNLAVAPKNHFQALAKDEDAICRWRTMVYDAFGTYPALDPVSQGGNFCIRLHDRPPGPHEELSLEPPAISYHASGTPIEDAGDGIKCFCGLLAAVIGTVHRIILIDEPEAFLPPPLARRLGRDLAVLGNEREASLVAATHSADFLLGCIEAGQKTTIIRLTFEQGTGFATARSLAPKDVEELVGSPFARSANVLSALFHRGAIVTEGDADRVFYEEINRRLRAENRGAVDSLLLNVNGKAMMSKVVDPLRRIGVPTAAVPDLDILENGSEFQALASACGIPEHLRGAMDRERAEIAAFFRAQGPSPNGGRVIQELGINALTGAERLRAERLLEDMAAYGLFPVREGQLESWFSDLGIKERKLAWLPVIFSYIGQNPGDANYKGAAMGGVWEFIDQIGSWIQNPNRRGTD